MEYKTTMENNIKEDSSKKEVRAKMYSWLLKRGIKLNDNDRKEIKTIFEEYVSAAEAGQSVVCGEKKYNPEKDIDETGEWRDYP